MQKFIRMSRVIQLASFLVLLPNLLQASSLRMSNNNKRPANHERWKGHVSDDVIDSNQNFVRKQSLNHYELSNKASQTVSSGKNGYKYSTTKPPSSGQGNLNQYGNNRPNCIDEDEEFEHRKKIWKASLILGSVGLALGKFGLISIVSPFLVVQDTTTSTSTTSTTSTSTSTSKSTSTSTSTSTTSTSTTSTSTTTTSTSTTTTPTTTTSTTSTTTTPTTTTPTTTTTTTTPTTTTSTTTTTIAPISCTTTTTNTAGDYKTIRNPGGQVAQCLAITVPVGSKIQISCTVVYTQAGTYTMFYTNGGTSLITSTAAVGVTYTSTDNTLTIESLAGSSNAETLCCSWATV